jgi:hypothetical protein
MAKAALGGDVKGALGLSVALILLGVIVGDSTLGLLLTPIVFCLLIFCMSRVPIRYSMMTLMFFALTLENPSEMSGCGLWKGPFYTVGAILLTHLNTVDRSMTFTSPLSFSGMDICFVSLIVIALMRRSSGSKIDKRGRVATPKPLVRLAVVSLSGMMFVWLGGLIRGGDVRMSLWQVDRVIYLPIVFLLFHVGLRGPKDHPMLARVLLCAASYKAILAQYIINTVKMPYPDAETGTFRLPYATSHHDSILFANAFVLVLAILWERVGKKKLALLLLPVLAAGIIANGRRMAWVQVGFVILAIYLVTPDNPVKKAIKRALVVVVPMIAMYLLVGWNAGGGLFKPVRMIKSVVDAKTDGSSLWRELENFDLISTVRSSPVFGVGYGNPYLEIIKLPYIDYDLERYVPHNSILGLWAYGGYVGYSALTILWGAGVYFGMRAYHAAKLPSERAAALVSFGSVLVYLIQCWGDMGLGSWNGVYTVGPALAVAGKLATATGGWGAKKKKPETLRPDETAPQGVEQPA